MLAYNPKERISLQQALKHEWFNKPLNPTEWVEYASAVTSSGVRVSSSSSTFMISVDMLTLNLPRFENSTAKRKFL